MIRVTTVDDQTGDTGTAVLQPDNYVLVLGEQLHLAGEVVYRNGTRVLTLKRNPPTDTEVPE